MNKTLKKKNAKAGLKNHNRASESLSLTLHLLLFPAIQVSLRLILSSSEVSGVVLLLHCWACCRYMG